MKRQDLMSTEIDVPSECEIVGSVEDMNLSHEGRMIVAKFPCVVLHKNIEGPNKGRHQYLARISRCDHRMKSGGQEESLEQKSCLSLTREYQRNENPVSRRKLANDISVFGN